MTDPYPLAGSLGDTIYGQTEAELEESLCRLESKRETTLPAPPRLSSLRPERTFGWSSWKHPDRELIIQAQIPPHCSTPVGVMLTFWVQKNHILFPELKKLGFPLPESDPDFIVGQRDQKEGKTTGWIPGPGRLASLLYASRGDGRPVQITICSELPLEAENEPPDSEAAFDWEGTLRFDSWRSLEARKVDEHIRPGRIRSRLIL